MKPSDVERAAILCRALKDWAEIESAIRLGKHWARSGMDIGLGEIEDCCGDAVVQPDDGSIIVDWETAKLIVPLIRPILEAELGKLGVEV